MCALDDVVLMEGDKCAALFLIRSAGAFIIQKSAVIFAKPFYKSAISLSIQMGMEYDRHGP